MSPLPITPEPDKSHKEYVLLKYFFLMFLW